MSETLPRPVVSVLMPMRDAEPWLAQAIRSLLDQSEPRWELVAVDDGSRDRSLQTLEHLATRDLRVRVFETEPARRGIVEALNRGLRAVRAPRVARMDADDVADPERLAVQRDALVRDPSLFAVASRVRAFPAPHVGAGMERYLAWQNSLCTPAELARDRFVESPVLHPSVMMRTDLLASTLGGWREMGWPEDWDLFLRAMEQGLRIARVARTLLSWRIHSRQATRTDPRYCEDRLCAARAHFLARLLRARFGSGRPAWVLGAGPVGKRLGKALAREGAAIAGFVDVDAKKIGGRIRDGSTCWPVISMDALFAIRPRPAAIGAVGRPGARPRLRRAMESAGWRECRDYVVAA